MRRDSSFTAGGAAFSAGLAAVTESGKGSHGPGSPDPAILESVFAFGRAGMGGEVHGPLLTASLAGAVSLATGGFGAGVVSTAFTIGLGAGVAGLAFPAIRKVKWPGTGSNTVSIPLC